MVIAVGLVFINRALGGQLTALRRIEETDAMLALARGTFLKLESLRLAGVVPSAVKGRFDKPFADCGWALSAEARPDLVKDDGTPLAAEASVTVERESPPASAATLTAVWPSAWAQ